MQPTGVAGSFLNVRAKVKVRDRRDASILFMASAVVHFASHDVEVDLECMGRSLVARVLVPIAPDEAPGPIHVSVQVKHGHSEEGFDLVTTIIGPADGVGLDGSDAEAGARATQGPGRSPTAEAVIAIGSARAPRPV